MKAVELKILSGMCVVAARRLLDIAEYYRFPSSRSIDFKYLKLERFTLFCVSSISSGERLRVSKKLQEKGFVALSQYHKGGAWSFQFTDFEAISQVYSKACEAVSNFDFVVGNGWSSYPQYSRTPSGLRKIEELGQILFNLIADVESVGGGV